VIAQTVACQLYDANGMLLAAGTAQVRRVAAALEAVVTALDQPGHLVARCLIGGARDLRLALEGGTPLAARVERIYFDARMGRTCTLRVMDPVA
jgi:hypothetical protein